MLRPASHGEQKPGDKALGHYVVNKIYTDDNIEAHAILHMVVVHVTNKAGNVTRHGGPGMYIPGATSRNIIMQAI
jgi:hypothetical protein